MARWASRKLVEEFNELAEEIQRRLDELEKYDPDAKSLERYLGPKGNDFYPLNVGSYWNEKTVREMKKKAKRLLDSGELSLEVMERSKATALQTLREDYKYDFIDGRNFSAFMHFLDDARARGLAAMYNSEQLVEAYHEMRQKKLTKRQIQENINRWANKAIKYDKEGKLIEREKTPDLKVVRTRVEYGLKQEIKDRHRRTKRIRHR